MIIYFTVINSSQYRAWSISHTRGDCES